MRNKCTKQRDPSTQSQGSIAWLFLKFFLPCLSSLAAAAMATDRMEQACNMKYDLRSTTSTLP